MRILLVDADSIRDRRNKLLPNLALMKWSAACQKNIEVDVVDLAYYDKAGRFTSPTDEPDSVFISCVFTKNVDRVHELQVIYPNALCGGAGYDIRASLPDAAEHTMPDYSLYGIDYSMGYTTRGCIRDCGFCIIPRKEGKIKHNAEVSEFLHPDHNKLMLLDNNFFAGPRWRDHVEVILEKKLRVCIHTGIDTRIMTDEMAAAIQTMDLHNWTFNRPTIYTALDNLEDEAEFRRGIERLEVAGVPLRSVIVYMIVGYHTTLENNLARLEIISEYKMDPFVMKYEGGCVQDAHFARWINRFFYKTIPFDAYAPRVRWKDRIRSSYRRDDLTRWA